MFSYRCLSFFGLASLSVGLLSALYAPAASAQNVYLTSGTTTVNDATYKFGTFNVGKDHQGHLTDGSGHPYNATLNMVTGGSVLNTNGYNSSMVNISGGTVSNASFYDTSTLNISGGSVSIISVNSTSTLHISGGTVSNTFAGDTSKVNISRGSVSHIFGLNSSTVNISGGSVTDIFGRQSSAINITGGTIGTNTIRLQDNSTVDITGFGLSFSSAGRGSDGNGSFSDYLLSGKLLNGQSLSGVHLYDYDGGLSVVDPVRGIGNLIFTAASPEPGTFALLLLGVPVIATLVRRRRTR